MPLYEYRCLKCDHVMEVLQKINDAPLRRCKKCSGKVEKLISRTSFHLKGGGWFAHGYGTGGSSDKSDEKSASKSPTSDTSKDSSTGEPKKAA